MNNQNKNLKMKMSLMIIKNIPITNGMKNIWINIWVENNKMNYEKYLFNV